MKYLAICLYAGFLSFALPMSSGHAATTDKKESTGEYVDDSVITTKIMNDLLAEPKLKSTEIKVKTHKGVVQLSGFVTSQADINRAVEIAKSVKGVTSVKNDMRLK
ncbi:BON domain-containing protein [Bdellovibrio svalbardensis]|uniref:BON domain-containing protein n=1 Tax=Bdellovibrio svalbardensis TaxID=2972972 RepID=A0ABT6DMT8_9BACT|nr:BON domain-containing protein [Bdellovibrio svalbardensis]MDG0818189.1 BON domain-containing protein [Bdellovibrio svalbardensis]